MQTLNHHRRVAYFTMEIALDDAIPTYAGGLGVLAGDTVRSAADLRVPMVVVSLLHRKGYFRQSLDAEGRQREEPVDWPVAERLAEQTARAVVRIEERDVHLRAWRFEVEGVSGANVPVYLLDSDLPENAEGDRRLTDHLYGGDDRYRLCQEVILGIGGVRMLRALGHDQISTFHMNEGHASLLTLELLGEQAEKAGRREIVHEDVEAVRDLCVFTTHTPVPAGHDQFPLDLVGRVLGPPEHVIDWQDVFCVDVASRVFQQSEGFSHLRDLAREGVHLNMTYLALNLSSYVNGVAKRHGEVSRLMFAGYRVDSITNGVHLGRWAAPSFHELFDRHVPGWREDNFSLRSALGIPRGEIWEAHAKAKGALLTEVARSMGVELDPEVLTLGFARRAAAYKRADLLFTDLDRLRRIVELGGKIQVVYAGKAHPRDEPGKELIRRVFAAGRALGDALKVVYLPDYDTRLGALITAGVDVWLNTPQAPNEASGTSGMKAALNGVPNLSILDGWWIEGHIEGVTGWSIGDGWQLGEARSDEERRAGDAASLYDQLAVKVLPIFYGERERFIDIMRHTIALNGSFFNTQRMMQQYVVRAYFR
ncbi:MAG: alpha-glucan family phosphorylase [Thermoanaerobaculia bacterium]|nr:alpha-glucan family phosphorylase [Thermoanaerobaculia bacterium]